MKSFNFKSIKIIFIFLFIISCGNNEILDENLSYEDSLLNTYSFIYSHNSMNKECFSFFESKISQFYKTTKRDSVYEIFEIKATLFGEHYSKDENSKIKKYAVFVMQKGEKNIFFIGIDKKNNFFRILNYLKEYDILTIDGHMMATGGFENVLTGACQENESPIVNVYAVETFDDNPKNNWVVDSVSSINDSLSHTNLFNKNSQFNVLDNHLLCFKHDTLDFEFEDYSLKIYQNKIEYQFWIVSYSRDYRILKDENRNYYFLSL